jgi:methylmalonyl-CoA/ethylmalonyl-CoA epimerase
MLQNVDHIAIVVKDLDDALGVYRDALGLSLERIEEMPDEQVRVAFLPLAEGNSKIELVQPTTTDSGIARFLAKHGEGIHHICLAVADIEAAIEAMAAKGLQIIGDKPGMGHNGQKYIFVHPKTTHGVLLELYEKPKNE